MRNSELRERLHIGHGNDHWYGRLYKTHCLETRRPHVEGRAIDWDDRDANWLIRLYQRNPKKTGYHLTHLITVHYKYRHKPQWLPRSLERYHKPDRCMDDQWRDMVHDTAIRIRTYQIMLNTLLQDAAKAGYPPLDSWTDTSLYDRRERAQIITETRRREPEA